MASSDSTPARWAPDPTGRFEQRWWDGATWTATVATGGQPSIDPLPVTAVGSAATATPADAPTRTDDAEALRLAIVAAGRMAAEADGQADDVERRRFADLVARGASAKQMPSAVVRALYAEVHSDPTAIGERLRADGRDLATVLRDARPALQRLAPPDREAFEKSVLVLVGAVATASRQPGDGALAVSGALRTILDELGISVG
jgi:hypothetical protein